jgi:hypothetical protein
MDATLHFEDWGASYGSPYLIDDEAAAEEVAPSEPTEPFHRTPAASPLDEVAFVDGVRRLEGLVYHADPATGTARGVVGAHATAAVVCTRDRPPRIEHVRVRRMLILGSGHNAKLTPSLGYAWEALSISSPDPDAPLQDLQRRMRDAEARLAEQLTLEGWLTIVDGPLNYARALDQPIVGYVKTHMRRRLPAQLHALVPELATGQRTPLFPARQSYSAYVRIANPPRFATPWSGIVRIEIPESQGVAAAGQLADQVTCSLPRFAGIPHKDPRAPQNLLPVSALERQLRHRLGPADRAARSIRLAVAAAATPSPV